MLVLLTLRCDGCGADRTDSSSWSLYPSMRGTRLVPSHQRKEGAEQREHVSGSATSSQTQTGHWANAHSDASVSFKQIADHTFGIERLVKNSLTFILPSLAPRRLYPKRT